MSENKSKKSGKAKLSPAELELMLDTADAQDTSKYDFTYTQNRELSWLQFDKRVLEEAADPDVPLFERFRMASIFESNLDEFVMVRVGSLSDLASMKRQPIDNKSNQTPSQQLSAIYEALPALIKQHDEVVAKIESELAAVGIQRVSWQDYTDDDLLKVRKHFESVVLPVASPQIIGSRHPFPNLRNKLLYTAFHLTGAEESALLGLVELPPTLPRVVELSKKDKLYRFTLLEDVLLYCAPELFGDYLTSERAVIRVTRNADIDPDEGTFDIEDDYRLHMKKILKQRQRLNPVRLEVQGSFPAPMVKRMRKALELEDQAVFYPKSPLSMGDFAFSLDSAVPSALASNLDYTPFTPQHSAHVDDNIPMYKQIEDHDILLSYPYESMEPFLRLLHESASDPNVMQIKITLYRVAKKSRLCESLIAAAENGIDVTVLMELRARFDEENNIEWAERLEDAGCTVLYGSAGFKVHSKICQITRRTNGEVKRITQLGTGNYNEKTAALYADYSYMTADPKIGEDANKFFRNMQIGNLNGSYTMLGVAPVGLKPLIMRCLNREIEKAKSGQEAYVCFKMNSLTDREVIDKLSEASCAGVKVDLIVRGICCLLPGVQGKTENISVRNIVGRKLEHARVYMFGSNHDTVYLSSADMMTRNTDHRVEIAFPIMGAALIEQIYEDISLQLSDNVKARILTPQGTYVKPQRAEGDPEINAQAIYMGRAIRAAYEKERRVANQERSARKHPIPSVNQNTEVTIPEPIVIEHVDNLKIIESEPVVEVEAIPEIEVDVVPEPVAEPEPEPQAEAETVYEEVVEPAEDTLVEVPSEPQEEPVIWVEEEPTEEPLAEEILQPEENETFEPEEAAFTETTPEEVFEFVEEAEPEVILEAVDQPTLETFAEAEVQPEPIILNTVFDNSAEETVPEPQVTLENIPEAEVIFEPLTTEDYEPQPAENVEVLTVEEPLPAEDIEPLPVAEPLPAEETPVEGEPDNSSDTIRLEDIPQADSLEELIKRIVREETQKVREAQAVPAPEPQIVEATPLPDEDEVEEPAPSGPAEVVSLMVQQKGRGSTAWALIKMGFRVLFGGGVK
ncbi:MAG: polyphosphate kinase 1 [Coriobacteriales bacterium]|nr:polyphosphate kinase 1 [Coriobacteriales bacterium]